MAHLLCVATNTAKQKATPSAIVQMSSALICLAGPPKEPRPLALYSHYSYNKETRRIERVMKMDKAKGKAKEAAGAVTDNEDKKAEGQAQQSKGEAREEAAQKERTRREQAEAKKAEKDRDREDRESKGLLGGVTDTLTGR